MIKKDNFEIISIIWGEEFTNFFLNVLIPNYLSENNIPISSKLYKIKSRIYTSEDQEKKIRNHTNFKRLSSYIETEIVTKIDDEILKSKNKWSVKGYCQSHAIKEGIKNKSILLLFNPDSLISDGFIKKCCDLSQSYKVVEILEFARSDKEKISKILLENFYDKKSNSITLSNKKLVEIGIENQLDYVKYLSLSNSSKKFTKWPSILYWQYAKRNVIAKSFHLHPISMDLSGLNKKNIDDCQFWTDDGGLIEYLGFNNKDIYVVTSSDELVAIELSMKNTIPKDLILPVKNKNIYVAKWANLYCLPCHIKNFLKYTFHFNSKEKVNKIMELILFSKLCVLKLLLNLISLRKKSSLFSHWIFRKVVKKVIYYKR